MPELCGCHCWFCLGIRFQKRFSDVLNMVYQINTRTNGRLLGKSYHLNFFARYANNFDFIHHWPIHPVIYRKVILFLDNSWGLICYTCTALLSVFITRRVWEFWSWVSTRNSFNLNQKILNYSFSCTP